MSYYTDYSNYTDFHEVDEDARTISNYNGYWDRGSNTGITYRTMFSTPANALNSVASRCCTIQTKKNKHHSPSLEGE